MSVNVTSHVRIQETTSNPDIPGKYYDVLEIDRGNGQPEVWGRMTISAQEANDRDGAHIWSRVDDVVGFEKYKNAIIRYAQDVHWGREVTVIETPYKIDSVPPPELDRYVTAWNG